MIVIPQAGAVPLLDHLLQQLQPWFHLYTNDLVPGDLTVLTDFTEATFPGYAAQRAVGWTDALVVSGIATSYADGLVFSRTMDGISISIYGYFVTSGKTGGLLWAEYRAGGPIVLTHTGDTCDVLPSLTLSTSPSS